MAAAAIAGAALGVGSSLAGPLLQNYQQNKERRWQESMWNRENEYNTPANQVRRLRQAGLNPALATSSGNFQAGLAGHVSGTSTPSYDFSPAGNAVMNMMSLAIQKKKNDAEVRNLDSNTQGQDIRNQWQNIQEYYDMLKKRAEFNKIGRDTTYLDNLISLKKKELDAFDERNAAEVHRMKSEAQKNEKESLLLEYQAEGQKIANSYGVKLNEARLAEMFAAAYEHNQSGLRHAAERALVGVEKETKQKLMPILINEANSKADESFYNSQEAAKSYHEGSAAAKFLPAEDPVSGETKYYVRPSDSYNDTKVRYKQKVEHH